MKTSRVLLFIVSACFMNVARAQDDHKVGVGISLEPTRLFLLSSSTLTFISTPVNVYLPISLSPTTRLEPDAGLFSFSDDNSGSGYTDKESGSIIRIGVGLLFTSPLDNGFRMYWGPRVGAYLVSSKQESGSPYSPNSTSTTSETDIVLSGVIGAEQMVGSRFSVGGEAQVNYFKPGNPKITPSSGSTSERSRSSMMTNALFFLRWYL